MGGGCVGFLWTELESSMCVLGGLNLDGVEPYLLRMVAVLCVQISREFGRSSSPAFPRREALRQYRRGDSAVSVGLEVRLWSRLSPVCLPRFARSCCREFPTWV